MGAIVILSHMVDSRTYAFEDDRPTIDDTARVSSEATLVGDVEVAADASVWPGVVLRGDVGPVRVGRETHVGDNATIHASRLASEVMVGHGAVLNETSVEKRSLIGFNATINTGVTIGTGSIVAAGTVVPDEYTIPPDSFVRGVPAEITPLEDTGIDAAAILDDYSSGEYTNLAQRHEELFD
ncbi:isoleucine patch superfamily enzyme, carbonic anhydrase/acetyltransferase [Natrinema pellirubrum DSM 15624]|uniref:Isoleucine patch superfamily enzyme, carbonic anhydrase/acetyltransferase n=2 Tax=Natrinema pellirubrum (strain DSM 15624 / CIP 106293 / JCM 10476 / NCIMB 786 / 157) TaxID=797303 RepID=L0JHP3_NATP1|nr:isoleucine patch superfamily enzyme, carbonic anhydrase/acetyltransferase [Natrinema pellirubrum DSM 15624]